MSAGQGDGCVVRAVVIVRSTSEQIATVAPQLGARRVKSVFQPVPIMLEQNKLHFTVLIYIVLETFCLQHQVVDVMISSLFVYISQSR
jgi:hypothetical protein